MVEIAEKEYQQLQSRLKEMEVVVAKRKQEAEEARRMATVVRDSNDAITIQDFEGNITAWNRGAELMFGYSEKEALQMTIWQLAPPSKAAEQKEFNRRLFNGERISSFETQRITKDGRLLDVWLTVTKLVDHDGKVIGIAATDRDITEHKRTEEELAKYIRALRLLSSSNRTLIHAIEESELINKICQTVVDSGYRMAWVGLAEEDEAKSVRVVAQKGFEAGYLEAAKITWADTELGRGPTGTAIRTGKPVFCRNMLTDPKFIPWREAAIKLGYQSSIALPLVYGGKPFGAISIYATEQDAFSEKEVELLTELSLDLGFGIMTIRNNARLKYAEEMKIAGEKAEAANRAKSEFLANMSHELRTPLNSINGFSEVLYDETAGPLNENQKKYVNYILTSGKHLLLLINQILNMAKIEAGKATLTLSNVPTKNLLSDTSTLVANMVIKKKIEMSLEIAEDVPNIEADELKVREIIYNLLSNAIKFTPEGGKIGMRAKKADSEIEIVVWDTGFGIAPENMEKIFEGFFRVDTPYSRVIEGTGLGLPLSRKLVELHGGKLSVESAGLNKGTTVRFTLPIISKKTV